MVRQELLERELQEYKKVYGIDLEPVPSNKLYLGNLFKEYTNWGLSVYSFCCNGEEEECWIDPFEEGIWEFTLDKVKSIIIESVRNITDTIEDLNDAQERIFLYEDQNRCYIYIYSRDMNAREDYHIFFDNNNLSEVE